MVFHRCDRARGFFSIYMTLAGVLLLLLLAIAPRLSAGPRRWRAVAPWLVMVLGLGATYTRGAWLGFAAGMLALLPLPRRGRVVLRLSSARGPRPGRALRAPEADPQMTDPGKRA